MRIWILLGLILLLGAPPLHAQEPPRYGLAFGLAAEELRVAAFDGAFNWRVEILPARVLFGEKAGRLVLPRWADAHTLYVVVYDPASTTVATTLYRYDLLTAEFTRVVQVLAPDGSANFSEFVSIDSISPDGRYAWVSRLLNFGDFLVDLQTGALVPHLAPCPARVLAWLADEVILACTGAGFATPSIFALDLSNGGQTRQLLEPPPDSRNAFARYVPAGQLLSRDRMLVGALDDAAIPTYLGVISAEAYTGDYYGIGVNLRLAPGQDFAAFYADERLQRLNLASGRVVSLGAAEPNSATWRGDTLGYWRTQQRDGLFELIYVESEALRRSERILYQGGRPSNISIAPQGELFALEFQPRVGESYIEVYDAGVLTWVSDFVYPNSFITLQAPANAPIAWAGEWLHLNYVPELGVPPQTVAVNAETGANILPPIEGSAYVGQSPDGDWWLYTGLTDPTRTRRDRLVAYHHAEGITVDLSLFIELYGAFQFPDWAYYVWSPY